MLFFYFTATADPFRVGVRAATAAAPLYVHASIRVGSATADQIVPLHKICAVQWYIGLVAQRSCVAAATASAAASAAAAACSLLPRARFLVIRFLIARFCRTQPRT